MEYTCQTCGKVFNAAKCRKAKYCNIKCYKKTGSNNPKWRGGSFICDGYRYMYAPEHPSATKAGYVVEHRLVMEKHLKRLLLKTEVIHHINGDRLNNNIENLVLCVSTGRHTYDNHVKGHNKKGHFNY